MKKVKYFLFFMVFSFLLLNSVNAKERIVCEYTKTGMNEASISFNYKIKMVLLLKETKMEVEKFRFEQIPENQCIKKAVEIYYDEETAKRVCSNYNYTYDSIEGVTFSFVLVDGDSCPDKIEYNSSTKEVSLGNEDYSYKLQNSKIKYSDKISCGDFEKIPRKIPELTSWAVTFIQVLVPVILVIMSMVDLIKAITSQKEDEIKKGQKVLIKRIVLAAIIFLFVALVKFVISIVANSTDTNNIVSCISCFIDGNCK